MFLPDRGPPTASLAGLLQAAYCSLFYQKSGSGKTTTAGHIRTDAFTGERPAFVGIYMLISDVE